MTSHIQVALVADDLTGALDAVAPFANAGLRCVVATTPAHLQNALRQSPEVISVSTNSRDLPAAQAAEVVRTVARGLQAVPIVIKKIDSRLKGNIAAEVEALAQVLSLQRALICPAIPEMGRYVVGGCLHGFGLATNLQVLGALAGTSDLSFDVPDALSDEDIDRILAALPPKTLLVGARGLSAGVARRMRRSAGNPIALPLPHPIAFAIGSRDPITLAQVAHLRQSQPQASYVTAPNGIAGDTPAAADLAILQATPGAHPAAPSDVTQTLAKAFVHHFATGRACLVLTGGETAAAVLAEMGLGLLAVLGEALPGLPLCRALELATAPLIVAKSGGFGAIDTLSLLVDPSHLTARQPVE